MDLNSILNWLHNLQSKFNDKMYGRIDENPDFQRQLATLSRLYPEQFYSDSTAYSPRLHMMYKSPEFMDASEARDADVNNEISRGPISGTELETIIRNAVKSRYQESRQKKYGMM